MRQRSAAEEIVISRGAGEFIPEPLFAAQEAWESSPCVVRCIPLGLGYNSGCEAPPKGGLCNPA